MDSHRAICEAATVSRAFLEHVWSSWHGERGLAPPIMSMWTCGRSSLFLQRVLTEDFGIASTWVTGCPFDESGNPIPVGFRTEGGWQGHSWTEAEGLIIDITADQFGLDPITVVPAGDSRYQASDDLALPESKVRRQTTIDLLWPRWETQKRLRSKK